MKKYIFILMMMVMAMPSIVCAKGNDKATAVFTVTPQMTCQNCENKIKGNLRFEKGVSSIVTDLKGQTVTVTYDASKTDKAKLVSAFKKIGYAATETTCGRVVTEKCADSKGTPCCPEAVPAAKSCQPHTQGCHTQTQTKQACDKPANCCGQK